MGKIVGIHGTKGVLKIHYFTESREVYKLFSEFLLDIPGVFKLVAKELLWFKYYKFGIHISMKGVASRDDAKILVGSNLYVKKSVFSPLEYDTYFWSDLIGMSVRSVYGKTIGLLSYIIRTGSNDVYVIKQDKLSDDAEILIPAIKSVVLDVDLNSNTMLVDLPDGLD